MMESKEMLSERRICQCCGMPLTDDLLGRNRDGSPNEAYCKWCYADGVFTYSDMEELIDVCIPHMVEQGFAEDQARVYMKEMLPKLDYWKRYEQLSDNGQFDEFKRQLIDEINALSVEGMPKVEKLNALVGSYVNLAYRLPNGVEVRFLDDDTTYLGTQLEAEFGDHTAADRCFGVIASADFILIRPSFQTQHLERIIHQFLPSGYRTGSRLISAPRERSLSSMCS